MKKSENFIILLCNTPNIDNAKQIANILVKEKLAACVNIISNVTSVYSWKGSIIEDLEVTLLIKSHKSLLNDLEKKILELHSYDTPELIQIGIENMNEKYQNWLSGELKK